MKKLYVMIYLLNIHCKIITILKRFIPYNHPSAGFSLIEVLVAILVIGFGAMTAISMQVVALRTTQQSAYQSIAVQLGTELADKIRTRSSVRGLAKESDPFLHLNYFARLEKEGSKPSLKNCFGSHTKCTLEEWTQFEIHEIEMRVKNSLPEGRIQICRDLLQSSAPRYDWACANSSHADARILIKFGWHGKGDTPFELNEEQPPKLIMAAASYRD